MNSASALLELQSADVEILRANKRLEDLPEKRAILEVRAKQREVTELRGKAELLVHKLESDLKAHNDEIAMLNDKLASEQAKVDATSDHRQVAALTREMDGFRRRVDKLEMESMQLMERIEKAKGQIATIDEALTNIAAKEASLIESFQAAGGEIQLEIAKLERRRKTLGKKVGAELLAQYESIRASRGGIGVGRLEGSTCSACRMSLPAERVSQLQHGDDVGICPQCRRLIVVRTGEEE